jgi:SAM-dependent methyltransferase
VVSGGVLRRSYDRVAAEYAARVGGELAGKPADRALLDRLAATGGVLGDLGCGPGHVAAYLAGRGATVVGVDLSPGMLRHAAVPVAAGDLLALPLADGSLTAAVAFYSLIHLPPGTEVAALREIGRVLVPGGTLLVAVHAGEEVRHLDEWWGVPVSVDFRFFPVDRLTGWLAEAGFAVTAVLERDAYPDVEVATRRAYVTAVSAGRSGTRTGSGRP